MEDDRSSVIIEDDRSSVEGDGDKRRTEITRRQVLKYGTLLGAGLCAANAMAQPFFQECPTTCTDEVLPDPNNCGIQEVWSTTPFILQPFIDLLPVPAPLAPGFRQRVPGGTLAPWTVRKSTDPTTGTCNLNEIVVDPTLFTPCMQDSYGGGHQIIPTDTDATLVPPRGFPGNFQLAPVAIPYHIRLQVAQHSFTSSRVRPINRQGAPLGAAARDALRAAGAPANLSRLPTSTIYGFNGTFPGPMINVDFGKPVVVRFENDLDLITVPPGVTEQVYRGDFGVPQFLTHLHNGHTAPESDGQPHYMRHNDGGYNVGDYVDNLYLNWPAGGDPNEMQSFLWFHDHRMHHTGANVYKGMVGLFPMYDPGVPDPANPGALLPGTGLDPGDETKGLRLPGVRINRPDGSFKVKYDIPMAFYDVRLDDGRTPHADFRVGDALINGQVPVNPPPPVDPTLCGAVHPEQYGRTFFRYHPNHGFVGDLFTVNGKAFPRLKVFKRRYRFRFLDASVSRCYDLALMSSAAGPQPRPGTQGQWQIPDGQLWRPMTQIASMGGLLPDPIRRNSIQIWPATRREVVVDFTNAPTGSVFYLTNIMEMPDGRVPKFNPPGTSPLGLPAAQINALPYKVPLLKIIVGGAPPEVDQSVMPVPPAVPDPLNPTLRAMPAIPNAADRALLPQREFTLKRSGTFGDASQWLINDLPFDPAVPLTELILINGKPNPGNPGNIGSPKLGTGEVWTCTNGGGGWVHPMHMHMEEHTVLARTGSFNIHPDDTGKEDVNNLDPGESVTFFRRFRTFLGPYVAHCHNLAHEDHNMMFGWKIV